MAILKVKQHDGSWLTIGSSSAWIVNEELHALSSHSTNTVAKDYAIATGLYTSATGMTSFTEGNSTTASGTSAHAEGNKTIASGDASHAEGDTTIASGEASHAEGYDATASGTYSHAEGYYTTASGIGSHVEGGSTTASGTQSHAEGGFAKASGNYSHAEGYSTHADGRTSHAEGFVTFADGDYSHAEGYKTTADGQGAHTEGYETETQGDNAHAEGRGTYAGGAATHVEGRYNIKQTTSSKDQYGTYAHILGNGGDNANRSNAHTIDWSGNAWFAGDVYVGSTSGTNKDEGSKRLVGVEILETPKDGEILVYDAVSNTLVNSGYTFESLKVWIQQQINNTILNGEW